MRDGINAIHTFVSAAACGARPYDMLENLDQERSTSSLFFVHATWDKYALMVIRKHVGAAFRLATSLFYSSLAGPAIKEYLTTS